ncbi:MAG: bifunctional riboflavin kinase/FAD synthetase [Pseudomonadales bacterium]|nr:bifunctional riboflavin kinase/FAD synthetase [Pseudomonadales bacterium]
MELIRGHYNIPENQRGCVATIGNFDGVHLGHQAVIRQLLEKSKQLQLPSVAMVFEPQPMEFFSRSTPADMEPRIAPPRISRFREKLRLLEAQNIDKVLCLRFDQNLSQLNGLDFIQHILVDGLNVKHMIVGDDFRFGHKRSGDFELMRSEGQKHGFGITPTDTFLLDGERVSSTRIRAALANADFALAETLLGRPFTISGKICHGQQLGRTLGVPTANIGMAGLRPTLEGVYIVKLQHQGRWLPGVANIGNRPTVAGKHPLLEVHLFDFNETLYGDFVTVQFQQKIRDEEKFDSLPELKAAMESDLVIGRQYFAENAEL